MSPCLTLQIFIMTLEGSDPKGTMMGSMSLRLSPSYADTGDKPWDGEVPEPVLKEIKEAKGKVHSMGSNPWW